MIKALIFDLDNTLIDRQRAFREGLNRIFHLYSDDEQLISQMIEDVILWDNNGAIERIEAFGKLVDKYRPENVDAQTLDLKWKSISGKDCYLYPDVRDTLTKLKEKYKLAVLSNGNKESQRRKMDTIAIYDLLDYSLIASEYIVWKPDKRIFEFTCQQLGLKPEECAYIGDSYRIDIIGSRNAGLMPVFVNRKKENCDEDITVINEISELLDIFKENI